MKTLSLVSSLLLFAASTVLAQVTVVIDFQDESSTEGMPVDDLVFAPDVRSDQDFPAVFEDAFGAGLDLSISYKADNSRFGAGTVTGSFNDPLLSDFLADRGNQDNQEYDIEVLLVAPANVYEVTFWLHASTYSPETLDVYVDDVLTGDDLSTSGGVGDLSGVIISSFTTIVTSDGTTPIQFGFESRGDGIGIAGMAVTVPEPGTVAMVGAGLIAVGCVAWRRRR